MRKHVGAFRERARRFYYAVLLSNYVCPECDGRLVAHEVGHARCVACGRILDLTVTFQKSLCCGAPLRLRKAHYACRQCGAWVPSKFLFDERVFDQAYFRERMQASRDRQRERRERVREMLRNTRSATLDLAGLPDIDAVPGLSEALDAFIGQRAAPLREGFAQDDAFDMARYRRVFLGRLREAVVRFSALPALGGKARQDRVRRFITLVFMEHDREVVLTPLDNDLLVALYETDGEG